jgi:AcrR family transcriptional regulator
MSDRVNGARRQYHSPRRRQQAAATRHAILAAARDLFVQQGYSPTTIADIAARAGVAVDTIYATVGRKPALLREIVESAISGTDNPVPAQARDYVQRVRDAKTAAEKVSIYAHAVAGIQARLGPVYLALRDAAASDQDCAALWSQISQRRATNMRALVADLKATGELRTDWSADELADFIWSMNGPEYWALLVHERGWTQHRYGQWLTEAWTRLLTNPIARGDEPS